MRIVSAGSADVCACCGTHVARTGEVGLVKITSAQHYKGGTRLTIACGMRALEDYRRRRAAVHEISALLSAKPDETPAAVRRVLDENAALHAKLAAAENARFDAEARACREGVPALRVCDTRSRVQRAPLCGGAGGALRPCGRAVPPGGRIFLRGVRRGCPGTGRADERHARRKGRRPRCARAGQRRVHGRTARAFFAAEGFDA